MDNDLHVDNIHSFGSLIEIWNYFYLFINIIPMSNTALLLVIGLLNKVICSAGVPLCAGGNVEK